MPDRDHKPPRPGGQFRQAGGKGHDQRHGRPPRPPFRPPARDPDGPVLLYGWHTVKAALENPGAQVSSPVGDRERRPAPCR